MEGNAKKGTWVGRRLRSLACGTSTVSPDDFAPPDDNHTHGGQTVETGGLSLPPALARNDEFLALLAQVQAAIPKPRVCLRSTLPGESFYDEDNIDLSTFTLMQGLEVVQVELGRIDGGERFDDLEPARMNAILRAILTGKRIPPIQLDAANRVQNGFHRYFAARLLEYQEVEVARPITKG